MRKARLAGCLAVSLIGPELFAFKEILFADGSKTTIQEPASTSTLAWNPHSHFELTTDGRATTVGSILVSGDKRLDEPFRLFIYPAESGFQLVGYPFDLQMDGTPTSPMYGFYANVEALTESLSSACVLPTGQIEDIRRTAITGGVQEIGGSHSPVTRLFSRRDLENIGMTFRSA